MKRTPLTLEEHIEIAKHCAAIYGHIAAIQRLLANKVRVGLIDLLLCIQGRFDTFRMRLDDLLYEEHGLTNSLHLHSNDVRAQCTTVYRVDGGMHDKRMETWFGDAHV